MTTTPQKSGDTRHTILVVDDQIEALSLTRQLLTQERYRVLAAASGEEALELFKENDVHLLLIDHAMPCMSGQALIRRIREVDPYVQIILVSDGSKHAPPPRKVLAELDIQGYHSASDGVQRLLLWVQVGLKTFKTVSALREREQQQSRMVSNVSHELKNPLALIRGHCELLVDGTLGALPQDAHPPLQALLATTHRLGELIDNFLLYAKLEAGAMNVDCQRASASQLAQEMRTLGTSLVGRRAVRFSVDVEDGAGRLATDVAKVRTILRNLVHNAIKFTSDGEISVNFERRAGELHVAVRDTGVGIATEDREKIFEPFRQLDGSVTRAHGGVGLGLALSRKLARLLGGDIEVEGNRGIGSTFTLRLPAGDSAMVEPTRSLDSRRSPARVEVGPTLAA
jgi:signal transduction histidine kinase